MKSYVFLLSSALSFIVINPIGATGMPIKETNKPAPVSPLNLNNMPPEIKAKIMNHAADANSDAIFYSRAGTRTVNDLAQIGSVSKKFENVINEAVRTRVLEVSISDDNYGLIKDGEYGIKDSEKHYSDMIFNKKNIETLKKVSDLRVNLSVNKMTHDVFVSLVEKFEQIGVRHINLYNTLGSLSHVDFSLLKTLSKLTSLAVYDSRLLEIKSLREIGQIQSLKNLEIYSEFQDGGLVEIKGLPRLERLLIDCTFRSEAHAKDIKAITEMHTHNLKTLILEYTFSESEAILLKIKEILPKTLHVEVAAEKGGMFSRK
ncbi:MAG: hypothetical protein K2X98_01580 [Alphaproteobacteria bacterium]|nr:hypothetical protein [Alphaproteobacteria bacterium]MBX9976925.1 hypothetical protein [Alphaproteobacteria bacterium]